MSIDPAIGPPEAETGEPTGPTPLQPRAKLVVVLTLTAAAIAAYLLVQTEVLKGRPIGCGVDSGCDQVLKSPWSKVLGLSVSLPALAIHAMIVMCMLVVTGENNGPERKLAIRALTFAAALLVTAAGWFTAVQLFLLNQLCLWCLIEHGFGLAVAITILSLPVIRSSRFQFPAVAGVIVMICFAGIQMVQPELAVNVREESANSDTGPGKHRVVTLLDGRVRLFPHELPIAGNPDAPAQLALLFDYKCSHCRTALQLLNKLQDESPNQFATILLPLPLDPKCNRLVQESKSGFDDSCEIAKLALGVFRAQPDQFLNFHNWLAKGDTAPKFDAARAEAERLVGAEPLMKALSDPWLGRQIQIHVDAHSYGHQAPLPLLMTVQTTTIHGFPGEIQLRTLIEKASRSHAQK